jgi:hypothetical protein
MNYEGIVKSKSQFRLKPNTVTGDNKKKQNYYKNDMERYCGVAFFEMVLRCCELF